MTGRVRKTFAGIEGLVHHDVEARVRGAVVRGRLESVDALYLYITKHTTGRGVLVALSQVEMVSDETTLIPRDEREAVEE